MKIVLFCIGLILILFAYSDLIRTTIRNEGAGLISSKIASGIWKLLFYFSNKNGRSKILASAGLAIILSLLAFWVASGWLGYALIFNLQSDSVVNGSNGLPTNFYDKLYYAGYTLSTLGNGDLQPQGVFWKLFSAFVALSGLILLTLAITYLIPVLSAVVDKRKVSAYIAFLGDTPEDILNRGWDGKSFKKLDAHFRNLSEMLLHHKERHLLYPIIHYFHSTDLKYAAPLCFSVLDEALSILEYHPDLQGKYNELEASILRKSMGEYLHTIGSSYIGPADETPPLPQLKNLKMASPGNQEFERRMGEIEKRRKLLLGIVQKDGWTWNQVYEAKVNMNEI